MPSPVAMTRSDRPKRPYSSVQSKAVRLVAQVGRFRGDEGGATAIEYALIAGLVFLAIVGGLKSFASGVEGVYGRIQTAIMQ